MIQACLTCPKERCTGECNRVYGLKVIDSGERYECFGHRYSVSDISNLTGRIYKTVLNATRKDDPIYLEKLLKPTYFRSSHRPKLYEYCGLRLRVVDWANILGISANSFVRSVIGGKTASEIVNSSDIAEKLHTDKYEAAFISRGQANEISHIYTLFEIYTQENMENAVQWAFECLRFKKVPERDEWLENINMHKSEIPSDYYLNGYYQVFHESHGYSLYFVEPCEK